jgi:hypothetical protein
MGRAEMESRADRAQHYREEARKYGELGSSGQLDITNFVHRRLAERYVWMAKDLERRENLTHTLVSLLGRRE